MSEHDNTKHNTLTEADLRQFTGGLERYRTIFPNIIYTPGVQYLAEKGEAYWLIDAVASHFGTAQMQRAMKEDARTRSLQFWRLTVKPDQSAILTAVADSGVKPFVKQEIPYTDFPLEEVSIWARFDGIRWTLYLPSEH